MQIFTIIKAVINEIKVSRVSISELLYDMFKRAIGRLIVLREIMLYCPGNHLLL
jgi:hypothetical protein